MASQAQVKIIEDILCAKCHRPAAHLTDHGITIQSRHSGANDVSLLTLEMLRYCLTKLEKRQAENVAPDSFVQMAFDGVKDCCLKTYEQEKWHNIVGAKMKSACCDSCFSLIDQGNGWYVWTPLSRQHLDTVPIAPV